MYTTTKTTFQLNWYANPYHTPLFVAQSKGWLLEEGIDLAILEACSPSDVTEVVGSGKVDMGMKAMIHVLAAKDRGIDLTSFGTILGRDSLFPLSLSSRLALIMSRFLLRACSFPLVCVCRLSLSRFLPLAR